MDKHRNIQTNIHTLQFSIRAWKLKIDLRTQMLSNFNNITYIVYIQVKLMTNFFKLVKNEDFTFSRILMDLFQKLKHQNKGMKRTFQMSYHTIPTFKIFKGVASGGSG